MYLCWMEWNLNKEEEEVKQKEVDDNDDDDDDDEHEKNILLTGKHILLHYLHI